MTSGEIWTDGTQKLKMSSKVKIVLQKILKISCRLTNIVSLKPVNIIYTIPIQLDGAERFRSDYIFLVIFSNLVVFFSYYKSFLICFEINIHHFHIYVQIVDKASKN